MTDPGRLFLLSSMVVASFASLCLVQPVHAQKWLSWRGSPPHGNDATGAAALVAAATKPEPDEVAALPVVAPRSVVDAKVDVVSTVLTPAHANASAFSEPLPSSAPAVMDGGSIVSSRADLAGMPDTSGQESACDEISRCDRLEVVRSGVGVEAPKDEAVKRRPENASKRNVLQSVRAVW